MQSYRLGLILITTATIIGSMAGLFTRLIAADTPTMLFWRGIFGTVGVAIFMLLRNPSRFLADVRAIGWPGLLFALIAGTGNLMNLASLRATSVAHNAVIFATLPFIAGAGAFVLQGERMKLTTVIAALAAIAGIVIMMGFRAGEGSILGDALALTFTLAIASIMLLARQFRDVSMLAAVGLSSLLSAIPVLPFAHVFDASASDVIGPALFGLTNLGLGFALFTLGSKLVPPAETGLIGALDAPLAPLWVWLIVGETPALATLAGGAIVFAAVAAHVLLGLREAQPEG